MYQYHCLNPISQIGLDKFTENYQKTEAAEAADAIWSEVHLCMRWNCRRT